MLFVILGKQRECGKPNKTVNYFQLHETCHTKKHLRTYVDSVAQDQPKNPQRQI